MTKAMRMEVGEASGLRCSTNKVVNSEPCQSPSTFRQEPHCPVASHRRVRSGGVVADTEGGRPAILWGVVSLVALLPRPTAASCRPRPIADRQRRESVRAALLVGEAIKRTDIANLATVDDQPEKLGLAHRRLRCSRRLAKPQRELSRFLQLREARPATVRLP